ncbi:AraC family transcriptional regulator [Mucilaginibacter polytrichastri]|nr:helix-turn-helix domain-containing protein [Mucilaginibacter polytrichastri]
MKDIPVHQLKDRANPAGFEIKYFSPGSMRKEMELLGDDVDDHYLGAHRDDHYLFFLLEKGNASLMIDFQTLPFGKNSLYYVLPGQVHHSIKNEIVYGWFIAVDTMLISTDYRNVFETQLKLQQPHLLDDKQLQQCKSILSLLLEKYDSDVKSSFYIPVVHSLLQSFIGMVACYYSQVNNTGMQLSRPLQLSQQFKQLLGRHIRTIKSPSAYAGMLNVSESYLNEALKKATGFSVSYWIAQEVVMEAKRLLYYSELNVKQIAHHLGYEDHTYFSRLFKKTANETPLEFRAQNRK